MENDTKELKSMKAGNCVDEEGRNKIEQF